MKISMTYCSSLALSVLVFALPAAAENAAWGAAQTALPAATTLVIGVNVASARSSQAFKTFHSHFGKAVGIESAINAAKQKCSLDPVTSIPSFILATDDAGSGAVFLATKNLDRAKIEACFSKLVGPKVGTDAKAAGNRIVEFAGGSERVFLGFVTDSVVAIATKAANKDMLQKWIAGGIPAGLKSDAGRVNTSAVVWAVSTTPGRLSGLGIPAAKSGYGDIDLKAGTAGGTVTIVTASTNDASTASSQVNKAVAAVKKRGGVPPSIADVLKGLTVTSSGANVVVKAAASDKVIVQFFQALFGQG